MSKFNNIRKFSYETGSYSGYWDTADVNYFVDSEEGSDLNNGLTTATPFKTLSKVKSLGTGIWENGLVIMCWGQFTENLIIDKVVKIIGAGGYNGRAVFQYAVGFDIKNSVSGVVFENIFKNDGGEVGYYSYFSFYSNNCIYKDVLFNSGGIYYIFNSILYNAYYPNNTLLGTYLNGNNNSFIDCTTTKSGTDINGKNNHSNKTFTHSGWALKETDSRYFTDNTETTPADLYIDSANLNFGIKAVFDTPIWDKTAAAYITANPLYRTGTYNTYTRKNNNIGAGLEALSLTGLNDSLNDTVDATYTNFEKDGNGALSRINDGIDGSVLSGIQDLGKVTRGVKISALHTYGFSGGVFNKHLGTSDYINDFEIQFGKTKTECNNMTPIKCEYGKVISYYNDNGTWYGNADADYDATMSRIAEFRYYKIKITAQTV
jgi:hypothetical protein